MQQISFRRLKLGKPIMLNNRLLLWLSLTDKIYSDKDGIWVHTDHVYLSDYCEDPHNPTPTELSLIELTLGITIDLKG